MKQHLTMLSFTHVNKPTLK